MLISTHAPLAGRDDRGGLRCKLRSYFNPRAPCGARRYPEIKQLGYGPRFQPTRPLRGATTQVLLDMMQRTIFQPTRPLRGATVPVTYYSENDDGISTHAPLAGRDEFKPVLTASMGHFNPRAPCGARLSETIQAHNLTYFNPRAPCGARPGTATRVTLVKLLFQPTRPLRGATLDAVKARSEPYIISTHAPLAGRDIKQVSPPSGGTVFQPTRPLRGATERNSSQPKPETYFNPRAPCGARRLSNQHTEHNSTISTHAPLAGRDLGVVTSFVANVLFQPTRPLRGATLATMDA